MNWLFRCLIVVLQLLGSHIRLRQLHSLSCDVFLPLALKLQVMCGSSASFAAEMAEVRCSSAFVRKKSAAFCLLRRVIRLLSDSSGAGKLACLASDLGSKARSQVDFLVCCVIALSLILSVGDSAAGTHNRPRTTVERRKSGCVG